MDIEILRQMLEEDTYSLLETKNQSSGTQTEEQRLVDSFLEINAFFELKKKK